MDLQEIAKQMAIPLPPPKENKTKKNPPIKPPCSSCFKETQFKDCKFFNNFDEAKIVEPKGVNLKSSILSLLINKEKPYFKGEKNIIPDNVIKGVEITKEDIDEDFVFDGIYFIDVWFKCDCQE